MKRLFIPLFATVAVSACNMNQGPSPSDPTTPSTSAVSYTVIGASDAIGYGSSVTCLPLLHAGDVKAVKSPASMSAVRVLVSVSAGVVRTNVPW